MNDSTTRIVQLPRAYKKKVREQFRSGSLPLDRYFREKVTQDIRKNLAKCFIALDGDRIAGFYTLSASSIALEDLPEGLKRRLRYEFIPAVRIGRLAVDSDFRDQRLGSFLLYDAALRAINSPLGIYALLVDAKNEAAKGFYVHHDFIPLKSRPSTLFIPLADVVSKN